MRQFTVLYQGRKGDVELHKLGCSHVTRTQKHNGGGAMDFEAEDVSAAIQFVVDDLNDSFGWSPGCGEPQPWSASCIEVLPCAEKG